MHGVPASTFATAKGAEGVRALFGPGLFLLGLGKWPRTSTLPILQALEVPEEISGFLIAHAQDGAGVGDMEEAEAVIEAIGVGDAERQQSAEASARVVVWEGGPCLPSRLWDRGVLGRVRI
jgi:hypothetical protein